MDEEITLATLKPGEKGRIIAMHGSGELYKRFLDMGITKGAIVEMKIIAPLGDPISILIKGYHLSLRKAEAKLIAIEKI